MGGRYVWWDGDRTNFVYIAKNELYQPVVRRDELFVLGLFVRLFVLSLKRAGTTLPAESLASNVITQAATTMKPIYKKIKKKNKL